MQTIWRTIRSWLETHAPEIARDLLPGADATAIADAAKALEVRLPADYIESLSICEGQRGGAAPLLADWQLIPLKVVVRKWTVLHDVAARQRQQSGGAPVDWWDDRWIPVATNNAGDHLCIDLSDTAGAKKGRVITYWRSRAERPTVAASFTDLLGSFAADLKANRYKYEDEALVRVR